jgi:hypothetical protein
MGKKLELRTNHYGLKHLFGQPTLNVRKTRWIESMSEYEFKIKKGKENQVTDALDKRDHEVDIVAINIHRPDLKENIVSPKHLDQ